MIGAAEAGDPGDIRAAAAGDHVAIRPAEAGDHVAIRPAEADDFAAILALNAAWVHYTSPLDEAALGELHAQAAYHRVAEVDGCVAGFLLAVGPGQAYESPNYRWFAARSGDFLYIDRVVVDGAHQGTGIGGALYDDVADWAARHGVGRLVCEVNVEPPNPVSDAFHERRGFVEVGTQWVAGGTKRVSLRELALGTGREAAT
ncbi:MAG: GNAT family N-acetyltransferase [Thermoleophilia bacterium]|nr:GNAT family N-acetyltransferase [Thermoleophilia bacterium]